MNSACKRNIPYTFVKLCFHLGQVRTTHTNTHTHTENTNRVLMEEEFPIREVQPQDLANGLFTVLSHLTAAPVPSQEEFEARLALMSSRGVHTFVAVSATSGQVVATATLLVEPKLIRGLNFVGHVEDVVVDPNFQGRKLGARLLDAVTTCAQQNGCYKLILDAVESNGPFYEKSGFYAKERQYRKDLS